MTVLQHPATTRFTLRDYQQDLVDRVWAHLQPPGTRVLAQLPTGGGKTPCQAELVHLALRRRLQVLVAVHRRELVDQLAVTIHRHTGVQPELVIAGSRPNWRARILVGMNQTLSRRLECIPDGLGLLLQDEAHHGTSSTYRALYGALPATCRLSGWTATPARLDGQPLADVFDVLECGPGTHELIAAGYLAPFRYLSADLMTTKGVRKVGGDYSAGDLAKANNATTLAAGVVDSYMKHARGKQTVIFAINVTHSRQLAWSLAEAGVNAVHVDGSTPPAERAQAIADFKAGRVQVLCSCDLFSEGLDIPGIEAAVLARPTASLTVHLQQMGRVLRLHPGKTEALIIDVARNWERHGLPNDVREWSLEGRPRSQRRPLQVDDEDRVIDVPPRTIVEGDADLREVASSATGFSWDHLRLEQRRGGHGNGWLWHRMREAGAEVPLSAWRELAKLMGRKRGWATHMHNCWSLRLDSYAQERARWEGPDEADEPIRPTTPPPVTDSRFVQIPLLTVPTAEVAQQQSTPKPVTPAHLLNTWAATLSRLGSVRGTQMLLQLEAALTWMGDDLAVIHVVPKWLGTLQLRREAIARAMSDALGHPIKVELAPAEVPSRVG